jgi:hypothetical protein
LLLVSNDFFNVFDNFIDDFLEGTLHNFVKESVEIFELVLD